jgi:hypothetical protein
MSELRRYYPQSLDFVAVPAVIFGMEDKDCFIKTCARLSTARPSSPTSAPCNASHARTEYRLALRERAKVWLMRRTTS